MVRLFQALFILICGYSYSQTKSFLVKFTDEEIILDGNLNEESWATADSAKDFWQYFPTDTIQAVNQAEIKMLFDEDNLYVGMRVNSQSNQFVVPSLRRDFRAGGSDNITLMFDTFNDGTNAILFGTNPYGVQREMLLSGGGANVDDFNGAWDVKWQSETVMHDDYYTVEWVIPFSSFKYREGETKWRFNSYHFDTQGNEQNTWINIPQNQRIYNLAYMGDMIFERPLGKSKSPINIIPYINGIVGKDYVNDDEITEFQFGGDAKLTLGNSLNLDLTINPDFSQVEVDRQVTNLTRFEVSLPERRQFFIENSDLFGNFGDQRDANAFFSRRIGIARDSTNTNIENRIIAGVRLSGKVNNNLRIGILNVQTAEDLPTEIPTTNNMVLTAQYKVFSRSNLSFMVINKQPTKDYEFLEPEERYNRVIGIDYKLASVDNSWIGNYYLHKSFSPNAGDKEYSLGASTEYNNRNYTLKAGGLYIGEDFRSDLGFIRRTDILKIDPRVTRTFWLEKSEKIINHSLTIMPIFIWRPSLEYENSDYYIESKWETRFRDNSQAELQMNNEFIKLYDSFDPTGTKNAEPLPANSKYHYTSFAAGFRSDNRQIFSYRIGTGYGEFFNGKKFSLEANMDYRLQPYFVGSLQLNYDNINLPEPYADASIWLIGPRIDITFNKSLFWATLVQYSTQSQNFSVNTRLQWRFAPLSDLFLVYNDNYFTDPYIAPRLRTLNLKVTYWLTL